MRAVPRSKRVGPYEARRARIKAAADALSEVATRKELRPNYARMNPRLVLDSNVFWFDEIGRAVIRGPWVYVHAHGVRLPSGMETVEASPHLFKAEARVLVTEEAGLAVLSEFLRRVRHRLRGPIDNKHSRPR